MPEPITLEVCVETVSDALIAAEAGADRIELCSGLAVGGLTPGPGLLEEVLARVDLPIVLLCRPRRGDFVYGEPDFAALVRDVDLARSKGLAGVATGVLTAEGEVDRERTTILIDRAGPLEVCFHRAFDLVRDQGRALEALIELGVTRILTSGGGADVTEGLDRLTTLGALAAGRITIMPGGGVSEHNASSIVVATGVRELHLSAGATRPSPMLHRTEVSMGAASLPDEYELRVTDPDRLRALRAALPA